MAARLKLISEIRGSNRGLGLPLLQQVSDNMTGDIQYSGSKVAPPTETDPWGRNIPCMIPSDEELAKMNDVGLYQLYWKYVNMLQVLCKDVVKIGSMKSMKEGGKEICLDEPYKPSTPCLVYSFGIDNQWHFDNDIVDTFGCDVHCFDPSMEKNTCRVSQHVWFYKWGLGGKNEVNSKQWEIKTLDTIRKELGHSSTSIDILKIDIEGDEWKSIPQMITSGTLDDVYQISMEIHFGPNQTPSAPNWGNVSRVEQLSCLRQLYEMGFRIFMRERNLWSLRQWAGIKGMSTNVNEISLIRPKR